MISIDYLRGFVDGEGSFIIRFREDKRYKVGTHIEPHVNITQKNKWILKKIQEETCAGKIYYHRRDELWHYNIHKIEDLLKFMNLIKDGLYVKKSKAKRFYECLLLIKEKRHLTKEGAKRIFYLWTAPETEGNTG